LPIYKLEPLRKVWEQEYTLWGRIGTLLGLKRRVTDAELAEWKELIYNSCTLCGRCSMVCPVGNDIVAMVRKIREGMAAAGHAPAEQILASKRAVTQGSPMGVKLPTLQAQIKRLEKETGSTIPMDAVGGGIHGYSVVNGDHEFSGISQCYRQNYAASGQNVDN